LRPAACADDPLDVGLNRLPVVGAALVREGRLLAARRRDTGGWEFPGGKVESGEAPAAAIERELREELGVDVRAVAALGTARDARIELELWQVQLIRGEPRADSDHDELRWLGAPELDSVAWLPVDRALLPCVHAMIAGMRFRATIELGGKTATGIEVPEAVIDGLGAGKRPPVTVTINGYRYRTTAVRMGGRYLVPLSAENRAGAGVAAGDEVEVEIALDEAPREVELPSDLDAALDAEARAAYDKLSFTHRKEWVRWVEEAKKPETRAARVAKTVEGLRAGRKTH
jgi:mutator protein MutT